MTTFAFPNIIPQATTWSFRANTTVFTSPLNKMTQTLVRPGSLWMVNIQFNNITTAQRAELQAFLTKLNGQQHRFLLEDHTYTLRGSGGGVPLVAGIGQLGNSLITDGWPISTVGVLLPGDFFQVGNELKQTSDQVDSNVLGQATIPFQPELRNAPLDNAPIITVSPNGVFMLGDPTVSWSNVPGVFSSFSFQAIEDILA